MYIYFYLTFLITSSHSVFTYILGQLNRLLQPNICADSLRCLILQCSSLSIILTSSHKGRYFPLSFYIMSAIPNFSILPHTINYRCFSMLIFSERHVSLLYTLPQLQEMKYTQFLVMLNSVEGLTQKRYLRRVEPLVYINLMAYGLHLICIPSAWPLT